MKDWGKKIICQPTGSPGAGWYRSTHYTFYFVAIAKVFISAGICSEIPLISNESIPTAEATIRGKLMKAKLQLQGIKKWEPWFCPSVHLPLEGGDPSRLCDFGQIT